MSSLYRKIKYRCYCGDCSQLHNILYLWEFRTANTFTVWWHEHIENTDSKPKKLINGDVEDLRQLRNLLNGEELTSFDENDPDLKELWKEWE